MTEKTITIDGISRRMVSINGIFTLMNEEPSLLSDDKRYVLVSEQPYPVFAEAPIEWRDSLTDYKIILIEKIALLEGMLNAGIEFNEHATLESYKCLITRIHEMVLELKKEIGANNGK